MFDLVADSVLRKGDGACDCQNENIEFIDALGWEVLQQCAFLDDILTVRSPLDTIFSYSTTCDPTILTGKLPREHGHFSFFRYDPSASPFRACRFLGLLPHFVTRRGRVRRQLSRLIQWYHDYTGYFRIYKMHKSIWNHR